MIDSISQGGPMDAVVTAYMNDFVLGGSSLKISSSTMA